MARQAAARQAVEQAADAAGEEAAQRAAQHAAAASPPPWAAREIPQQGLGFLVAPPSGWWLASDGKWYPPRPGWWIASDGRWYPPELHPNAAPNRSAGSGASPYQMGTGSPAHFAPWQPYQGSYTGIPQAPPATHKQGALRVVGTVAAVLLLVAGLLTILHVASRSSKPTATPTTQTTSGAVSSHSTPAVPVDVPIVDYGRQGVGGGALATVVISLGEVGDIPALLDTGSTGIRVFLDALQPLSQSGVTLTSTPVSVTFGDGTIESGVMGSALFTIEGVTSTTPVPLEVVEHASCLASLPDCPGKQGAQALEQEEGEALIGIGLESSQVPNPLLSLPGADGKSWSIGLASDTGRLTLAAPAATHPIASFPVLDEFSGANDAGFVNACWTVTGVSRTCVPTLFDTGTTFAVLFEGGALADVRAGPTSPSTAEGAQSAAVGLHVTATAQHASRPFWSFTVGTRVAENAVQTFPGNTDFVNTGVAPFFDFLVTYQPGPGVITLSPLPSDVSQG